MFVLKVDIGKFMFRTPTDQPDSWEYHTVAVNYSRTGEFPLMGILPGIDYNLDEIPHENGMLEYFRCVFESKSANVLTSKPPLYSFLLGKIYSLGNGGFKDGYWLNLFFLVTTLFFLILISHQINKRWGWILGTIAAIIYIHWGSWSLSDILPELTLTAFLSVLVFLSVWKSQKTGFVNFLLGATLGILFLIKGMVIFLILFYPICRFLFFSNGKKRVHNLLFYLSGLFVILFPWQIIKSEILNKQQPGHYNSGKLIRCESALDIFEDSRKELIKKTTRHYYNIGEANENYFLVSNQANLDELLGVHNEYAIDGQWHPEWRFIPEAIYNNRYLKHGPILKIIHFYWEHPEMIWKIGIAKLRSSCEKMNFPFLFLSIYLFGLVQIIYLARKKTFYTRILMVAFSIGVFCLTNQYAINLCISLSILTFMFGLILMVRKRREDYSVFFPLLSLNSILFVCAFFGAPRFVEIIEPFNILSGLFYTYYIVKSI